MYQAVNRKPVRPALRLETLEDRAVPATVVEAFDPGSLSQYDTVLRYRPFAEVQGAATHDGTSGLAKRDGYEWMIRGSQTSPLVQQGQVVSVWMNFADVAAGRAYFGFGARPNPVDPTGNTALRDGGTLSVVLAPNTNEFLLQANPGFNHPGMPSGGTFAVGAATLGAVAQSYAANTWYRVEVEWAVGGAITARLYGSDGTSLLNTVSGSSSLYTQGGIAFRSFGRPAASADRPSTDTVYFDTVVVAPIGTAAADLAAAGGGVDPAGVLPPSTTPAPVQFVSTVGGALVPWLYQNTPADEDPAFRRDLLLREYGQPTAGVTATREVLGPTSDPNTLVVFSAGNDSFNLGTDPLGWGGPYLASTFQNGVPNESPVLGQYLFRQLPGDDTRLIASADIKHFYTAVGRSSQFLLQGENDIYGTSLNSNRNLFLPAASLDPRTGDLLTRDDFGPRNVDGVQTFDTGGRGYTGGDLLLRARIADVDPALNPPGTRWFLMGTLFTPGDEDVTNNSRWVEVRATVTGSTVNWATLNNPDAPATGTLNFRTIPGLRENEGIVAVAPTVTAASPGGATPATGQVDRVRVTFASAIDPATFTAADVTAFTGPGGPVTVLSVVAADGTNTRFDILIAPQTAPGAYTYAFGPDIRNAAGTMMTAPFAGSFTLAGVLVQSTTPNGTNILPGQLSGVVVQFNQPVDPLTVTADTVRLTGPLGPVALTGLAVVDGSGNTRVRLDFSPQFTSGAYSVLVGPEVANPFGVAVGGTGAVVTLGVQGVRGLTATPNVPAPGATTVRVRFNLPLDPATFTLDQVVGLSGPGGPVGVAAVAPVDGTNGTEFDLTLAAPLTAAGGYTLTLGLGLRDLFGNLPDGNNNLTPGEPDDGPVLTFAVAGPRVVSTTLTGQVPVGTGTARLTFNNPIDPATLTAERVLLTGPGGPVAVTGVAAVDGSGNTAFDLTFAPLSAGGAHTLALAAGAADPFGNAVAAFSQGFSVALVTANATAFEKLDLNGQAGTTTVITSGDDVSGVINLGANRFTFYGVTYDRLFVSSNGLITFGEANTAFQNGEWPTAIPQPAIAALWDDLIKSAADAAATGPMVLSRVDGDRLVVQWNRVRAFDGAGGVPSVGTQTFQAILQLNTGSANGDVVLNYLSLVTADFNAEGLSATVGVKPAGTAPGDNLLTVSVNGQTPAGVRDTLVRTGQAVRIRSAARDPRVTAATPGAGAALGVGTGRLTFNMAIDPATLTAERVLLTGPGGPVAVTGVAAADGSNTVFDFTFAPLTAPGTFTLALGAGVTDATGFAVNPFTSTFTIAATTITSTTLTGTVPSGTATARVTFNRAIDPASLTAERVLLTRSGGAAVAVTGVTAVGAGNTTFDLTFDALTTSGTYTLALAAGVADTFGNPAAFTGSFSVAGAASVTATATAFRDLDLIGDKTLVIASGDDVAAQINLGDGNTFRFFGVTYDRVFVNSNGLITFGSSTTAFGNTDLTADPDQAAIAVLWDDWVGTSGNPVVVFRIRDNELIIQWNRLRHFTADAAGADTVTFQAILSLNTGDTQGDVVLNYLDVGTGAAGTTDGRSATVGVKAAGPRPPGNPDRLLVSFDAESALVGSGRAVRISPTV
ncbi:MAG: hypothetical protein C0501_04450 [Isosphaera sp.]|nr:hypothetical protein [Isosphaera sp.]